MPPSPLTRAHNYILILMLYKSHLWKCFEGKKPFWLNITGFYFLWYNFFFQSLDHVHKFAYSNCGLPGQRLCGLPIFYANQPSPPATGMETQAERLSHLFLTPGLADPHILILSRHITWLPIVGLFCIMSPVLDIIPLVTPCSAVTEDMVNFE